MVDESLDDLKKRLELISKIRQQVNLVHNVYENRRILGKSNFQKVHSTKKGESSRDFIVLGNGAEYLPPIDALKKQHKLNKSARNIIQDYDDKLLPSVIRKPTNFFPYNKYDFVGKRQEFVRTATGQSTDIVPYVAPFRQYDEPFHGPTQDGATGFEAHATAQRENEERIARKKNRYSYMRLQAEKQRDMKGRVYESAPWMKSLIQSGKLDKKHLPAIDKNIAALAKIPGGRAMMSMMKNPYAAIPLMIGQGLGFVISTYSKMMNAHSEDQRLEDAELFGREGHGFRDSAYAHGLDEMGSINSFQKVQAKYGPATYAILEAYAQNAGRSDVPAWAKQQFAMSLGLDRDQANIAMMMYGKKKPTKGHEWMHASVMARKDVREKRKSFGGVLSSEAWEKLIGSDEQANAVINMETGFSPDRLKAIHRNYRVNRADSEVRRAIETHMNQTAAASSYGSRGGNSYSSSGSYTVNAPININIKGDADPKMVASSVREGMTQALDAAARQRNLSAMTTEWVA